MGEETITVGEISRGDDAGRSVELPIVDLLTGRGFVTGKSGSGKSNSASVIAEKLLDRGYSLLAVDIDGEYYGLKEEYEILHVGADDECDLQVGVEHAGKIAELALEQNVPIILDVSSFLDESKARELLTEVTKHLFAKEKKLKQPFLMLVEEIHEYIPEGGGVDECGRMLVKVGKRGRKHGLGIVGISQRPADVKKDFITQCDWLVWHRLTWNNDTKVVSRILGSEYADHIEEMDDGECFLMSDWDEEIQLVQFERKQTFDAGATPGLDDFERPELKSVSGDLVSELQEISESKQQRKNRVDELQRELKRKDERIADLERQLSEAQDLKKMADRFSRAMMEQVTGRPLSAVPARGRQSELDEVTVRRDPELERELDAVRNGNRQPATSRVPDASTAFETEPSGEKRDGAGVADAAAEDTAEVDTEAPEDESTPEPFPMPSVDPVELTGGSAADESDKTSNESKADADIEVTGETAPDEGMGESEAVEKAEKQDESGPDDAFEPVEPSTVTGETGEAVLAPDDPHASLVSRLRAEISGLDETTAAMLEHYREYGPTTPQEAHTAAGGSGDRTEAYAANRALRKRGFVAHVGRGQHDYALTQLLLEETTDPFSPNDRLDVETLDRLVRAVESTFVNGVEPPAEATDDPAAWPDP